MLLKNKIPLSIIKLINFEYWSWKWFYLPLVPYCVFPAWRARSLTFFTNINASFTNDYQGLFGEDKIQILNQITKEYRPYTLIVCPKNDFFENELEKTFFEQKISYPVICKPNKGERGTNVEKVNNSTDLKKYFTNQHGATSTILIQEFIDYEVELGVFYIKMPNEQTGKVTSVTRKDFLKVTGDGKSTILELMQKSTRARFQIESIKAKMGIKINNVLAINET
nr:hypothetical protein [Pseudarcicella sp.]